MKDELKDETRRWVEAGIALATDPHRVVQCPVCQRAALEVMDQATGDNMLERHLRCTRCGAYNSIRMSGRPAEGIGWSEGKTKGR